MNSDQKRLLRHLESYDNPNIYNNPYYSPTRLGDRIFQPGVLLSLAFLAVFLYHHLSSQNPNLEPLPDLLWNGLVRITPARLLDRVDRWLHPPLYPIQMLQTQTRSTTHAVKSEALRRVLGMDKAGGIVATVSQAGRRGLTSLSSSSPLAVLKGDVERPAGLGNISNSCYQNSVLQGLASLRPLRTFLASVDIDTPSARTKTGTVETLRELVHDLNSASHNGKTLWTPTVLKNMSTWQQQDAQEYFSKLLDEIDREMARLLQPLQKLPGFEGDVLVSGKDDAASSQHSDDSGYQSLSTHSKVGSDAKLWRNPLEGLQAQRVACTACGHSDGLSMIPFNCITLNLDSDGDREYNLYERLDSYTRVESIPGVECGKCTLLKYKNMIGKLLDNATAQGRKEEDMPQPFARLRAIEAALEEDDFDDKTLVERCLIKPEHKVSSTKTKQAVIARPPQSLAVHVNRSVFDERTGMMYKNYSPVRFPTVLDLGPWCLGSAASEGREERWILDPLESMVAGAERDSKILGPVYELRAVITHQGRHENGHYVCYRRHAKVPHEGGKESEKPAKLAAGHERGEDVDGVAGNNTKDWRKDASEQQDEDGEESQWWRLSDQDVTKIDEERVLAQSGVFMLFYDCVDPNSTLASEVEPFVDAMPLQRDGSGHEEASETEEQALEPQETASKADENALKLEVIGSRREEKAFKKEVKDEEKPLETEEKISSEAESALVAEESTGSSESAQTPVTAEQQDLAGPAPVPKDSTGGKVAVEELERAKLLERAKALFAKDMDRAASMPLPDEDEGL
jgi:ubiquitin carboxyl-terminal hydrolase 1